jgi:hypothetical protein
VPLIEAINAITNITATFMNPLRKLSAKWYSLWLIWSNKE